MLQIIEKNVINNVQQRDITFCKRKLGLLVSSQGCKYVSKPK